MICSSLTSSGTVGTAGAATAGIEPTFLTVRFPPLVFSVGFLGCFLSFETVGFLRRFSRPFLSFETAVGFLRRLSFAPTLAKVSSHSFHFLI